MIRVVTLLNLALIACAPQPRDVAWFEAHADEAQRVVAACSAGHRSSECDNARAGLSRARADVRRRRYREGFE